MQREPRKRARRAVTRFADEHDADPGLELALKLSMQQVKREEKEAEDAPVFRPSVAEFLDPLAYIASIKDVGRQHGIVKIIPPEGWVPEFHPEGIRSEKPFTTKRQRVHKLQEAAHFEEGGRYTQQEYRDTQAKFEADFWAKHPQIEEDAQEIAATLRDARPAFRELSEDALMAEARALALEKFYWRVVDTSCEEVVVDYAHDLDVLRYGSAFGPHTRPPAPPPAHAKRPASPASSGETETTEQNEAIAALDALPSVLEAHPWEPTRIAVGPQSLLRRMDFGLEGVTRPWLYYGALFATFSWHTEDHHCYSINYMHRGAAKSWYGVPQSQARQFESCVRRALPLLFRDKPDVLYHMNLMVPPTTLINAGVKVVRAVQRPGEFIVTFPEGFHGGFSHGWNCAEAVNFALVDWLPAGREAMLKYRSGKGKRSSIFAHDKLVYDLACEAIRAAQDAGFRSAPLPAAVLRRLDRKRVAAAQAARSRPEILAAIEAEKAQRREARRARGEDVDEEDAAHGRAVVGTTVAPPPGGEGPGGVQGDALLKSKAAKDATRAAEGASPAQKTPGTPQGVDGAAAKEEGAAAPAAPSQDAASGAAPLLKPAGVGELWDDSGLDLATIERPDPAVPLLPRRDGPDLAAPDSGAESDAGGSESDEGDGDGRRRRYRPVTTARALEYVPHVGVSRLPRWFAHEYDWSVLLLHFAEVKADEDRWRSWLRDHKAGGLQETSAVPREKDVRDPEECCICQVVPYLSVVKCECRLHPAVNDPEELMCPEHAFHGCTCKPYQKTMEVRVSDEDLETVLWCLQQLAARHPAPEGTPEAYAGQMARAIVNARASKKNRPAVDAADFGGDMRCSKSAGSWRCKEEREPGSRFCAKHAVRVRGPVLYLDDAAGAAAAPAAAADVAPPAKKARVRSGKGSSRAPADGERCVWNNPAGTHRCRAVRAEGEEYCKFHLERKDAVKHSVVVGGVEKRRCQRTNGREWQCSKPAEEGSVFCKKHYTQNIAARRRRKHLGASGGKAAVKKEVAAEGQPAEGAAEGAAPAAPAKLPEQVSPVPAAV
ncbi:unnamed protein product [Pedinophyceae sp. YPF-701]|nr:unnamed protein product [Pedinophyceae sp. YPF-701]